MAVVLRSNTDLVYLPDHGFVGEEGALRILMQVQANTSRLDVSHNLLGSGGVITLVKGLAHVRHRYSSDTARIWSLKEINLGCNSMDDEGLESVLGWAKKDLGTAKVLVQANDIKLAENVDGLAHTLNSTHLNTLSLTNNPLNPAGLAKFLSLLDCPTLTQLHLSTCKLPPSGADAVVDYLISPRSRNLEYLELNGNGLGAEGVRKIVDAVERYHFGIVQVGLLANERKTPNATNGDDGQQGPANEIQENEHEDGEQEFVDPVAEGRQLHHEVHERLPELVLRNRLLTRRIRKAALRALAPARILLQAQPPSDQSTASRVIAEVSSIFTNSGLGSAKQPFPILDLPPEVLNHIVRHCSQDPYAFSGSQFARLRTEAANREELGRMVRLRKERLRTVWEKEEQQSRERNMRDEWLKRGKWDKWEAEPASF